MNEKEMEENIKELQQMICNLIEEKERMDTKINLQTRVIKDLEERITKLEGGKGKDIGGISLIGGGG
jgi:hypothetical protein